MSPIQAALLGVVEGLTEFLPVSSTGHLILVSRWLRLRGEAVDTFDIVIQAGALAAVAGFYSHQVASMWRGLLGQDAPGRQLLGRLVVSFLPAAAAGLALHRTITAHLFRVWPVVSAIALGGVVMIFAARWLARRAPGPGKPLRSLTLNDALLIGCAQVLSLWPGTSRSMVTMVAALLLGFSAPAAAEYSFLLALPTLGAATLFDAMRGGHVLWREAGGLSLACGFAAAAVVAVAAIRGLLFGLTRWGLAPFGWYRIGLAGLVWMVMAP